MLKKELNEYDIWDLALLILHDKCPPEPELYYCNHAEDDCDCTFCWQNYLNYVGQGRRYNPYRNTSTTE